MAYNSSKDNKKTRDMVFKIIPQYKVRDMQAPALIGVISNTGRRQQC
jgi:hypothetical protein